MQKLNIRTDPGTSFEDITDHVRRAAGKAGIEEGICCVYVPHTTAAVTINEHADPSVCKDMDMEFGKLVPMQDGYLHMEGNSAAHIKSTIVGESVLIPISNGELCLGTWQGIYFCEFDGPRTRQVYVTVR